MVCQRVNESYNVEGVSLPTTLVVAIFTLVGQGDTLHGRDLTSFLRFGGEKLTNLFASLKRYQPAPYLTSKTD